MPSREDLIADVLASYLAGPMPPDAVSQMAAIGAADRQQAIRLACLGHAVRIASGSGDYALRLADRFERYVLSGEFAESEDG